MDADSSAHQKLSSVLKHKKTQCIAKLEPINVDNASQGLHQFRTPQKITFNTPKTPKSIRGDDLASVTSKAVREKAKHMVLFYQLFLLFEYSDLTTSTPEIVLGNLSETFLAAINAGHSEGTRIFTNAFTTYRKERLHSDSFLDTVINFLHTNRTMISLLMLGDYRSTPLEEDTEYLSQ